MSIQWRIWLRVGLPLRRRCQLNEKCKTPAIFSNIELIKDNFKQRFSHNNELAIKKKLHWISKIILCIYIFPGLVAIQSPIGAYFIKCLYLATILQGYICLTFINCWIPCTLITAWIFCITKSRYKINYPSIKHRTACNLTKCNSTLIVSLYTAYGTTDGTFQNSCDSLILAII